ncbi:MAG: hypothetical protein KGI27_02910 [Thaumarchaeota archaeon]|nr:hypothetical protein [Nitrososphaerota archaeon]
MSVERILDNIMNADKHIRYATIFDLDGNEIKTSVRKDTDLFLDENATKETLRYSANAWKIRKSFAPRIGKGQYVLAVYEKLRRLTVPVGDKYLLMITWGTDAGISDIIERIENMFSGDYTKDPFHLA